MEVHQNNAEPWRVTLVDTGENTMTGGRMKRVKSYVGDHDFCMTYGDGVGNINIRELILFHQNHRKLATVTATQMPGRFGALKIQNSLVTSFQEKPVGDSAWISGGFFVLSPKIFDYIKGDTTTWEREPVEQIARESQMEAFFHKDFWHPMDTLPHKNYLESLWSSGMAPWKIWL